MKLSKRIELLEAQIEEHVDLPKVTVTDVKGYRNYVKKLVRGEIDSPEVLQAIRDLIDRLVARLNEHDKI